MPLPKSQSHLQSFQRQFKQGILTDWEGSILNTFDLLIKVACFVNKVNYTFNTKTNWSKLVGTRRSSVLSFPLELDVSGSSLISLVTLGGVTQIELDDFSPLLFSPVAKQPLARFERLISESVVEWSTTVLARIQVSSSSLCLLTQGWEGNIHFDCLGLNAATGKGKENLYKCFYKLFLSWM